MEQGVQRDNAIGEKDALGEWDFGGFNLDPYAMMGDEEFRYDGDALLENILQPTDETENAKKLSDSVYESGSPEIQRRELAE